MGAFVLVLADLLDFTHVVLFLLVQSVLSIVKAFNKAFAGRIVRLNFPGPLVLQRATSLGILGGLAGAGIAGLVPGEWCFVIVGVLYILSLVCAKGALSHSDDTGDTPAPTVRPHITRMMVLTLVFSVPSSALLPYLNTLAVPLADAFRSGSIASFLSVLTLVGSAGGILAGAVLGTGRIPLPAVLGAGLPLAALCAVALSIVTTPILAAVFFFACTFFGTMHVLSMQVLTNQAPPVESVASFTLLRNACAGLAKAGASVVAGLVVAAGGLSLAWNSAAIVLLLVGGLWVLLVRRREVLSCVSQ